MNNKIIETLETLEDRIESIKWLITGSAFFRKSTMPSTINIIRKSAGILGRGFPKGTVLENKMRRAWKDNSLKRVS